MENSRFLECLDVDYRRLREVVPGHLERRVPSCPDWSVEDLTRHVAEVYLHKTAAMREGAEPENWPPDYVRDTAVIELLDDAYRQLTGEFITRDPAEVSGTWYGPDQTAGFWIRRMAQETVIHRIDAELGAGVPVAEVPSDLAVDGVDELLRVFVEYSVSAWGRYFTEALGDSPGHTYLIMADATADGPEVSWLVRTAPGQLTVAGGPGGQLDGTLHADVTVSGTPTQLLRWAWNREAPGEPAGLRVSGDADALAELRRCVVIATQ